MAISLTYSQTPQGLTLPDAYVKINNFMADKETINIQVGIWINADARWNGSDPFEIRWYSTAYFDGISLNDLYDFIKTKPEFEGWVDV